MSNSFKRIAMFILPPIFFATGLVTNIVIQVRPQDAISNIYEWLKSNGIQHPPSWLEPKSTDHTIHIVCVLVMIITALWFAGGVLICLFPNFFRKKSPTTPISATETPSAQPASGSTPTATPVSLLPATLQSVGDLFSIKNHAAMLRREFDDIHKAMERHRVNPVLPAGTDLGRIEDSRDLAQNHKQRIALLQEVERCLPGIPVPVLRSSTDSSRRNLPLSEEFVNELLKIEHHANFEAARLQKRIPIRDTETLMAIKSAREIFEKWAVRQANWQRYDEVARKLFDTVEMNMLLLSFRSAGETLIVPAESYGIDAMPLRIICKSSDGAGGESEVGRNGIRTVMDKLEGEIHKEQRSSL